MKEKLWYEFVHIKYGDCYLSLYLSSQQTLRKWVKILTLLFSTGGILGWTIWKQAPIVSCILVSVIQLFHLIKNEIMLSESDIGKIAKLRTMYYEHANKLEQLWTEFQSGRITEDKVSKEFFKLRNDAIKLEELDGKLNIKEKRNLMTRADSQTRAYIVQYHS